jgi:DNA-binding PadR family transcriptional regulator/anti-sigma regulatory factor (Ser/Thr protein kinase)
MPASTLRESAFLLLTALAGRPQHGYTLIEDIDRLSGGRVRLRTGTLYALLERLREAGHIELDREEVVASRLRRYYRLTEAGAAALAEESDILRGRANAADSLLRQPTGPAHEAIPAIPATPAGPSSAARAAPATVATTGQLVHRALFYRNTGEYLAATVPFVVAGLDAGEVVAVIVPSANLRLIRDGLNQSAVQVRMLDMAGVGRNPGRIIPALLLAFIHEHNGRAVRIVAEPIWAARTSAEYPACVQHEALINTALAGHPATILCAYDSTTLKPHAIHDAYRTHPTISNGPEIRGSDSYDPDAARNDYNIPLPEADINQAQRFRFNPASLPQARAQAVAHADRLGLPASRHSDVELAVAELASNSVRFGGGHGRLIVGTVDGDLVCQVQDAGTISDPLAGRRPAPETQPTGRGLLIVNRAADLVRTYTAKGSTVTRVYFGLGPL